MTRRSDALVISDSLVGAWAGIMLMLAAASFCARYQPVWRSMEAARRLLSPSVVQCAEHHCPLCGMSRAFVALWRGDLGTAESLNPRAKPLFCLMLLSILVGPVYWVARAVTFRTRPSPRP
ncbi:DUF2752 domain-containing protein [Verrucomicrobiota bacterium]